MNRDAAFNVFAFIVGAILPLRLWLSCYFCSACIT
jgi:hypothetical protein